MSRHNKLLSASEARITKRVTVIERKQATINVYNKKVEQLIASTGYVNSTRTRDQGAAAAPAAAAGGTRETGPERRLQQRKVRTESEMQQEQREQAELERHMKELMADMLKLNSLLSESRHVHQALSRATS
uniref:Uncharacterized protein n=1 Tax=Hucho hucho TaxID=62062 RepID=A0A4W5RNQ5_9TELE